ncbi:MAG: class I SAM-dependent methyltransferase [bacterium]|nr:class I SAM-dependent methyltransferase [bacterium]MCM1375846.1 class I SAM-dependent methyltransferase [Muribaculum sp.]
MRDEVALSARMRALTEMVTPGNRVCDVGCDHGWVSIYLVQQGISPRVLAMDVRRGPLSRAQKHIRQRGLEAYIETRLSDGVAAMRAGEADTVICAGMGGRLMQRIIEEGRDKLVLARELILQPQSELRLFRAYLRRAGYLTLAEDMVYEDGKYYPMMKVTAAPERETENVGCRDRLTDSTQDTDQQAMWDCFGEQLLAGRHPVLRQYLLAMEQSCGQILEQLERGAADRERAMLRCQELEEERRLVLLALEQYYSR